MSVVDEAAVFNAARRMGACGQREAYLREACGADEGAYERLAALLQSYDADPEFLETPPVACQPTCNRAADGEGPGSVLGHYRLLERIGEGGFAVVYAALQSSPLRRQVAVKVIKAGMDSQQVISRFEAERQTLALMDHPGIAQVFDAGVTEAGRPYFVMQLIRGEPITDYCDRRRLTIAERLQLFLDVCRAVQHAHHKGVIHRDLKPSNVLVEMQAGRHVPKVIDFGIAKATDRRLQVATVDSQCYQIMGTPRYMSPEQADCSRRDVDTRSDIYSLGVLLYEMLTGGAPYCPYDSTRVSDDATGQPTRRSAPKAPSSRVVALGERATGVAALRRVNVAGLRKTLRGELDWIVLKCLETSRERRYDSADALGQDIERQLAGLPPREWRISLIQRAWRWSARNRLVAALSLTVVTLVLLVATIAPLVAWQQQQLVEETRRQLYAKDVAGAYDAWHDGEYGQTRDLLAQYAAGAPYAHLRDFAWRFLDGMHRRATAGMMSGRAVAVAAGANRVAVAKSDRLVHLYDAEQWLPVGALPWRGGWAPRIDYSSDGRYLAQTDDSARLSVWECATQRLLFTVPIDDDASGNRPVRFSPDGSLVAAGGLHGNVKVWQCPDGLLLCSLEAHRGPVSALAFSPTGGQLATASWDASLRLWSTEDWTLQTALQDIFTARPWAIAFDPTGRRFACGGWQEDVQIRDAEGRLLSVLPTSGASLSFSPDGGLLATGIATNGAVEVWNLAAQKVTAKYQLGRSQASVEFLPSGLLLVELDDQVFQVDPQRSEDPLAAHNKSIRSETVSVAAAPRGDYLAASYGQWALGQGAGGVVYWDLPRRARRQLLGPDGASVSKIVFAELGERIVAGGGPKRGPGFLGVWDSATGELMAELPFADTFVRDLDVSPQGDRVALVRLSYADNARLEVWGNLRQQPELVWSRPATRSHDIVAYSPCGTLLAVGRLGGGSTPQGPAAVVTLWDAATGRALQDISWDREITRIAFSVEGRFVASIDWNGGLELFDRQRGTVVLKTKAHNPVGSYLAFAPDGRILATSSSNCEVKFWHLPTLMRVATLPAHARVSGLAFFPDGRTLAVGCLDRTVELWHVDRDREIWRMEDVEPLSAARQGFDEGSTWIAQ